MRQQTKHCRYNCSLYPRFVTLHGLTIWEQIGCTRIPLISIRPLVESYQLAAWLSVADFSPAVPLAHLAFSWLRQVSRPDTTILSLLLPVFHRDFLSARSHPINQTNALSIFIPLLPLSPATQASWSSDSTHSSCVGLIGVGRAGAGTIILWNGVMELSLWTSRSLHQSQSWIRPCFPPRICSDAVNLPWSTAEIAQPFGLPISGPLSRPAAATYHPTISRFSCHFSSPSVDINKKLACRPVFVVTRLPASPTTAYRTRGYCACKTVQIWSGKLFTSI